MSVRRLAEKQPESFAFTPENQAWAEKEIAKYPPGRQASAVIALLWRAQKQNGYWLSKPAIETVAAILEMPKIRVLEVATFYTMFNLEPVGRYYVQLCGTTPCMLRGAEDIKAVLRKRVGEPDHVTADGLFSWSEVECLGACCNAPMVQINDDYYEDLTPENFSSPAGGPRRRPSGHEGFADRPGLVRAGRRPDRPDVALWRGRQGRAGMGRLRRTTRRRLNRKRSRPRRRPSPRT